MPSTDTTNELQATVISPLLPPGMPYTPTIADFGEIESQFIDEEEFRTFAEADDLHRELRIPADLALDFHEDLMEAKREFEDPTGAPEGNIVDRGDDPDFNSVPVLAPAPPIDPIQHLLVRKKSEELLALPTGQPRRPLPNPQNEMLAYRLFPVAEGEPGQSDWKVGDPPPPLSSFLASSHFQCLSTEQRNLAFDRWSRYFNHWVARIPGYTDSLRADHTATMRQVHDWIDSEKTIGEYAAGLGSSLWSTLKGIVGGPAMQLGETTTNFLDTNSSYDNIIGAKTTQVFDRWGRDIAHRYDETLNRDDLRDYEEQGFTIQTIRSDANPEYDPLTGNTTYRVDRREKLDEALSAFQHDLDTGNHPGGLAYTTWLGQWNKKIVDLATDYNREDRITLDRSLNDHESSRFFRKNETLAAHLLDYRYTRRQATFDEIVRILTETDKRKQTEEDIAVELEDPNGVVAFAKDHLSPENFQIVLDAGTDPVEIASNAASLVYGLGTAGKVAKATERTVKQTTRAVGKNAAGEALVEGATEGFAAFVDDSRADVGSAAREGAIMGILLQGVSATGGAAYSGARKGIQTIHEFHADLKQLNEQLDSIGGNYNGLSEAELFGQADPVSVVRDKLDNGEAITPAEAEAAGIEPGTIRELGGILALEPISSDEVKVPGLMKQMYAPPEGAENSNVRRQEKMPEVGAETEKNPSPYTFPERLTEFYKRLGERERAKTAKEALEQLRKTLDEVEDEMSGVIKKVPPPPIDTPDGRMYPPLDDYVERHEDGSITARTRGHNIFISPSGAITIYNRKTKRIDFEEL